MTVMCLFDLVASLIPQNNWSVGACKFKTIPTCDYQKSRISHQHDMNDILHVEASKTRIFETFSM